MSRATVQTTSQLRQGRILHRLGMLAIAPMLLFAACSSGDDGGGSPPATNNNTTSSGADNQLAYVIDSVASEIRSYTMDGSGNLTQKGTAIATGSFPHHVDVDPAGRFVYVSNHDSSFVSGWRITSKSDPTLIPINPALTGSPVTNLAGTEPTENEPHSSVIDQSGQYLYVIAGTNASTLRAYRIDSTTGLLTFIQSPVPQSFPVGIHAHNLTISPNNQFLYVAVEGDGVNTGEVRAFLRNTADGTLTPKNIITPLPGATAVKVDPQNTFLYASYSNPNAVEVFQITAADGSITKILPTSTFLTNPNGSGPHSMAMHPSGKSLYTANINANTITVFGVDSATGVLTDIQPSRPTTGSNPNYVLVHPNGKVLFTADTVADQVSRYTVNADGTLTPVTPPIDVAVVGDGPNGIGTTNFNP